MSFQPADWHNRFIQQARWTQDMRNYLLHRANISNATMVLEVGCGSGVILRDLVHIHDTNALGVDIKDSFLDIAAKHIPSAKIIRGDANALPIIDNSVDISLCHFFLLWVTDPVKAIVEMVRVTKPGGSVLALAEPDYGGRIDYPPEFVQLGKWQIEALQDQGADPFVGRRLAEIFSRSGLSKIETGVLGGLWTGPPSTEDWNTEWSVIESDLVGTHRRETLEKIKKRDKDAWSRGERTLFVPTFYSWGRVPSTK